MTTETKTTPADINVSEIKIMNEQLLEENKVLKARLDELDKQLKQANDVIEADIKGRLSKRILTSSKYTVEDLAKMSVDEMKQVEKVLDMSLSPFKGVRGGAVDQPANITVPDKYAFGDKRV